jgi:hypothetical protein
MRFDKGHKENTRKRIIDVAFRKDGVSASGFDSKETLVREAVSSALTDQFEKLVNADEGAVNIEDAIRRYLNKATLSNNTLMISVTTYVRVSTHDLRVGMIAED